MQKPDPGKEHGRLSDPKSSTQQAAAAATEQPENGIDRVKVPKAALNSESSAQHAAVAAVRQQPENAEKHARASGAAPALESTGLQAQPSQSMNIADGAEQKLAAAPGQTALSEANPACSSQQAAAGSAQQAQPVSSAAAEMPREAAASEASPAGCGQQAASSSGRRFTRDQQGVAAALMVVLSVEQRKGRPLRVVKLALGVGNPTTHPFLTLMPDEGTLPSLKELEQCADAAFLEMLDSLAAQYARVGVRPLDGLSADLMEGLGISRIDTVAQEDGVQLVMLLLAASQVKQVYRVIFSAFQKYFPGMMDCLMRQGENGKHDRDLRLVEVGETAAVEAAASLVTCQIQAYKEIACQWGCSFEELLQSLLGNCLFAHDVPLIRNVKNLLLKIAKDTLRVPQKARVIHMSMCLRRYRRDNAATDGPMFLLLNRVLDIAYENAAGSPIMIAANQAFPGVFDTALEHHEWPKKIPELLDQRWMGPAICRLLSIVTSMRTAFKSLGEQQGLTWKLLINARLDKIQEICQCPGLQKADVDIIIYTYREFYESFGKAEDYDAISAYQEFFKSSTAELTAESKAKAADQGGASSLETATASQRAMPERGTGTRPQRAMSMQERPAAQQKKALPEEEAATAPQHKPLLTQKSTQLQEKASPSKPSQEDASAEEKQAGNNRTHSKEQASVKWADAMPELKAFEAAREEVIAACEALALAEKAQEAARENVKVSREHEALREAERAKKKQAKKARQRATRAQAAARDQPPQQEAPSTAQPLKEPDLSSTAHEASAVPGIAAQVPVSQNRSRSSRATKHAWKAGISQEAEGGDPDAPAAASGTAQKASRWATHPQGSAPEAECKPDGEDSAQCSEAPETLTQPHSSPSTVPRVPARPQPPPSMRRGPAAQAPACQAAEEKLREEGSWQKVTRSRHKQPQRKAAAKGRPSNVVHSMPPLGRVLPEQDAPAGPDTTPQQAQRLQVPPVLAAAQEGRHMPEPQGGAMPEQAAPPRLRLAPQQAHRMQISLGSAAAPNGLSVPRLQPADTQLNSASPEECAADDNDCVVCLDNAREVVFLPCGHMCACQKCSKEVMAARALCPMCCQAVEHTMAIRF